MNVTILDHAYSQVEGLVLVFQEKYQYNSAALSSSNEVNQYLPMIY